MTTHVPQVGGDHYQAEYAHWDWCAETGLGYLEGNATKYLARFRKKNGRQDLEKALSYVEKIKTIPGIQPALYRSGFSHELRDKFIVEAGLYGSMEADLIVFIDCWSVLSDLSGIAALIRELINAS